MIVRHFLFSLVVLNSVEELQITLGRFLATYMRSLVVLSVTSHLGELFLAVLLQPAVASSPSNKNGGTALDFQEGSTESIKRSSV